MKRISISLFSFLMVIGLVYCGGSSDEAGGGGGGGDEISNASSGSVAAAAFAGGGNQSLNALLNPRVIEMMKRQAEGAGERDTCNEDDDGPQEVDVSRMGTPGTYGDNSGAGENGITVADEDFCLDSEGNENDGDGPDGNGLFASFTLNSTVSGTCTEDGEELTFEMTAGTGIWRNTEDSFPEIFGTFTINGDEVDCSIALNENQSVREGGCSMNGEVIALDTSVSCEISATNDSEEEDEDDMDGDGEEPNEGEDDDDGEPDEE